MTTRTSTIARVLLLLSEHSADRQRQQNSLLLPATVLTEWFGARLQLATTDTDDVDRLQTLSTTLGVPTEPVLSLHPDGFVDELTTHARVTGPSVIVTAVDHTGMAVARRAGHPTFLVGGPARGPRLAAGPLVVPLSGQRVDLDALATAAAWGQALDLAVRLVASPDEISHDLPSEHEGRLRSIGIDAGIDRLRPGDLEPAVQVAATRGATAIILSHQLIDSSPLVDSAIERGIAIIAAPHHESTGNTPPFRIDLTNSGPYHRDEAPTGVGIMTHDECLGLLARNDIGRLAYVDHGWPIAVPVNYRIVDGDVIIRSLPGGKLEAAERQDVVCLEIDGLNPEARQGWSVLAHGHLSVISDAASFQQAWDNDPDPWVAVDEWRWLRLSPFSMTGRHVG